MNIRRGWMAILAALPLASPAPTRGQEPGDPATEALARQAKARDAALRASFARVKETRPDPLAAPPPDILLGLAGPRAREPFDAAAEAANIEAVLLGRVNLVAAARGRDMAERLLPNGLQYMTSSGWVVDVALARAEGGDGEILRYDLVLTESSFQLAFFGRSGSNEGQLRDAMKTRLEQVLRQTARSRPLTRAEEARLRLAGGLDIKHFFDRLAEKRRDFRATGGDLRTGLAVLDSLRDLHAELAAPFGEGSLFAKTRAKLLADGEPPDPTRPPANNGDR